MRLKARHNGANLEIRYHSVLVKYQWFIQPPLWLGRAHRTVKTVGFTKTLPAAKAVAARELSALLDIRFPIRLTWEAAPEDG